MWLGGSWGNTVMVGSMVGDTKSKYFTVSVREVSHGGEDKVKDMVF